VDKQNRQPFYVAAAILAVALATAIGLVVGYQLKDDNGNSSAVVPANDSVDAGFARDMQVHHAQAVEMAFIVRDNTDDPAVRTMAYDIARTQEQQMGQMYGWLSMWGLGQYSQDPPMAWMHEDMSGHHGMAGMDMGNGNMNMGDSAPTTTALMPGMATSAQMEQLRETHGPAAEVLFLQMMIRHHLGGIEMAKYAAAHAEVEQVRQLAETMAVTQQAEVKAMNDMLVERGAQPVHSIDG